jgi:hypothetical protein
MFFTSAYHVKAAIQTDTVIFGKVYILCPIHVGKV